MAFGSHQGQRSHSQGSPLCPVARRIQGERGYLPSHSSICLALRHPKGEVDSFLNLHYVKGSAVATVSFLVSGPACVFVLHAETLQSHLRHREVKKLAQGIMTISQRARPKPCLPQRRNSFFQTLSLCLTGCKSEMPTTQKLHIEYILYKLYCVSE